MVNKIIILGSIFIFLALGSTKLVSAQGMMGYQESGDDTSLKTALRDIFEAQGINNVDNIDCTKVTSNQLEKLGEGWMDYQMGEGEAHEQMDDMMGGEGSDSLTSMHAQMGKNYLGCNGNYSNSTYAGMMGAGMMSGFSRIPFDATHQRVGSIFGVVLWILTIALLTTLIRLFWKKGNKIK